MKLSFSLLFILLQVDFGFSLFCIPPTPISQTKRTDLQYYLYLQPVDSYTELVYGQVANVPYNPGCPVIFITHGFTDSGFKPWILDAKNKIFQAYPCANVVIVDWSNITSTFNYSNALTDLNLVYPYTAYRTCYAGEWVAQIITEINSAWDISFADFLLMGHSLGAHLMGCAGQYVTNTTGGLIGHIIGMDPAGPLFNLADPSCRLSTGDASFVQAIRTSVGAYGMVGKCGDADFYVNGGQLQPGCPNAELFLPEVCYHCYAYLVTPASFTTNGTGFDARNCSDYASYELAECNHNTLSQMGRYSRTDIKGPFYLDTTATYPYTKSGGLNSKTLLG